MYISCHRPTLFNCFNVRQAQVLEIIFHQCVISYTCSQPISDGSVLLKLEPSEIDWLHVYDMTHLLNIVLRNGASLF